ncbi:MAG: GTP-binding protein [Firmicutes bacterium]|nr:GTP-binding protein [Bacillota bacterium]
MNNKAMNIETMNIVIVGHVDHGKSTVIGRLLADTGSLPQGKLEQVRKNCERNAKPFEYAFLLDALKDEQAQGITIDTARCFFKTGKRHYIIIDAPGHIEFLKNMITGAARAEAALLVIDAKEGVQENSRRHGFMLSLLGIKQIVVLINKMDLVAYQAEIFERIQQEYRLFLEQIHVIPQAFVPISARDGDNLVNLSEKMPWYQGLPVLELVDGFQKEKLKEQQPFRFPVQDVYKFTEGGDDRRIIAGTVETGTIQIGDEVVFLPSKKKTLIQSIEGFNEESHTTVSVGKATGFTLATQIYVKAGEIMVRAADPPPIVGSAFKANLFWLGKNPMIPGKKYKLKIATNQAPVYLQRIITVLDAPALTTESDKTQIDRHDVAECILKLAKPIAYDLSQDIEATGRFVIIDNYEIVGGGIIVESVTGLESHQKQQVLKREYAWERSNIKQLARAVRYNQKPRLIVFTGPDCESQKKLAQAVEENLFGLGHNVYYLGISNLVSGLDSDMFNHIEDREEHIRRLGELAHIFTDAGLIILANIPGLDDFEIEVLKTLNEPNDIIVINIGLNQFTDHPEVLQIADGDSLEVSLQKIRQILYQKDVLLECYIKNA